jgi:hypothetical protein
MIARAPEPQPVRAASVRPWWRYSGIGWPRSLGEIRLSIAVAVFLSAATIWGYLFIGPRGRNVPGRVEQHMTDFTVFPEAGAAFFDGRDPYRVTNPRGWHYLYPPLFALLLAPLSLFDTETQVVFWYVVNVALMIGCLAEFSKLWRRIARTRPENARWFVGCAAMSALLPFLDCMQAGQLGIGILYLLLLGFRLGTQTERWLLRFFGGVILALPAVVKLVPALPVGCLLLFRWTRVFRPVSRPGSRVRPAALTLGVLIGACLFIFVVPASLIGWRRNLDYLREWQARVVANDRVGPRSNFNIHSYRNQSLANAAYLWDRATARSPHAGPASASLPDRPERIVHREVRVAIGIVLAMLLVTGVVLSRGTESLEQAVAYSLACCATLLVSPLAWGHYYMALVPAVLVVPIWLSSLGMPVLSRVIAVIPPVLSWLYYVAMPYTGGFGLLGLGTTAWFLGVCGLILGLEARRAFNRRSRSPRPLPPDEAPRGRIRSRAGYLVPGAMSARRG